MFNAESESQIFPFETYTVKEGLLSNSINCMMQDSRGYIWLGTGEGISVFDGTYFTNYNTTQGIPSNNVLNLLEDPNIPGVVWSTFITNQLTKFVNGTFTTTSLFNNKKHVAIFTLHQEKGEPLWLGTENGIYWFDGKEFTPKFPRLAGVRVWGLEHFGDSLVWVLNERRLFIFSATRSDLIELPVMNDTTAMHFSSAIYKDRAGRIWTGMSDGTISCINGTRLMAQRKFNGLAYTSFTEDRSGTLYASTTVGLLEVSLTKNDSISTRFFIKDNGLPENAFTAVLFDHEENLWLSTFTRGFAKLSSSKIIKFLSNELPANSNNSTGTVDHRNHLWLASTYGIREYWQAEPDIWKQFVHPLGDGKVFPVCVKTAVPHSLWILYNDARIEERTISGKNETVSKLTLVRTWKPGKDFPEGIPYFFILGQHNYLWYSNASRGIVLFDRSKSSPFIRLIDSSQGLPENGIRAMYEDRNGNLWFGGNGLGLSYLSSDSILNGKLKTFTIFDGLPENAVRSIHQDRTGTYWIGTRSRGMATFDGTTFETYNMSNGLLSNTIWSIIDDARGGLLFATASGVMTLDDISSRTFKWYNHAILYDQILTLGILREGTVWGATVNYLFVGKPRDISPSLPPPVYITNVAVNGTPISWQEHINLEYDRNNITVDYIGIGYKDEGITSYEYQLLGSSEPWNDVGDKTSISFASLQPGGYTFSVRAVNAALLKSTTPAVFRFTINPPYWQRWWFVSLSLMVLSGVIYGIYRYRLHQMLNIERMRTRIASDLHDDIGASLSRIALFSEVAKSEAETSSPRLFEMAQKIGDNARELLDAVSTLVWTIDPRHDKFEDVLTQMKDFAQEMFTLKNIDYTLTIAPSVSSLQLPIEARKNVLLIFKEAVNNIVRHSECSNAEILLRVNGKIFEMSIADDGKGFPLTNGSHGHGLTNMKNRATSINGFLEITSRNGSGTRIHFTLLPKSK